MLLLSTYSLKTPDGRTKMRHIWNRYVAWGVAYPLKFNVMAQLRISDQITAKSRAFASAPFAELERLAKDSIEQKLIRDYPLPFIGAMFGALAEATMGFVAQPG